MGQYWSLPITVGRDALQYVRKKLSNNHVVISGAEQSGKSTLEQFIHQHSKHIRAPLKTNAPGPLRKLKVDYLTGGDHKAYTIQTQDNGGERIYWKDTLSRIVNNKPRNIIFMLRAFNVEGSPERIKRDEHLVNADMMSRFALRPIPTENGTIAKAWVCEADMAAFEFLSLLLLDYRQFHETYADIVASVPEISTKLYNRRKKLKPKRIYMVVNFSDILEDGRLQQEARRILTPYEPILKALTDKKIAVEEIALSARFGHNVENFLKGIGEDNKWT